MSEMRPKGMRRVRHRVLPDTEWQTLSIGTEVQFETELGDIRVKWDANTGRVKILALGYLDVLDAIDVQPVGSNAISVGLIGERL